MAVSEIIPERSAEFFQTQTLEETIQARHSTRAFLPTPVSHELLLDTLKTAQQAPSNSNIQNWKMLLTSGPTKDRLVTSLMEAASIGSPNIPPLPPKFSQFRQALGARLYGTLMGIERSDHARRNAAVLRNFRFFSAPVAGIVCMDRSLSAADAASVGMWLQTWLLALTAKGLGSCVMVSVAGYEEVLRRELGIGDEMKVLFGVAVGYEDSSVKWASARVQREDVEKSVQFLDV